VSIRDTFDKYILPGLVFQSVVVGGGYGTGRELAEFFLPSGPLGGLMAMGVAMLVWGAVAAASFEFARVTGAHDYRTFFKRLIGPFAPVFEILFVLLMLLIIAVVGAAAGEVVAAMIGAPPLVGTVGLLGFVVLLVWLGVQGLETFAIIWPILLYAVYLAFMGLCVWKFGDVISGNFASVPPGPNWAIDGTRYAGYNLAALPALLFLVRRFSRPREAIGAGLLAGFLAILPAGLFFVAMVGLYPSIQQAPIPAQAILDQLSLPWLTLIFQIMLFGTLVDTAAGLLHGFVDRVESSVKARGGALGAGAKAALSLVIVLLAVTVASRFGIIDLVARGYGIITYGFVAVYVVPVLTLGVWSIYRHWRAERRAVPQQQA